jgi:hypothetical protein
VGLGGAVQTEAIPIVSDAGALEALTGVREHVRGSLKERLGEYFGIKWLVTLVVTLVKLDCEGEEIEYSPSFRGDVESLLLIDYYDDQFNEQVDLIMRRLNEFLSLGSGWVLKSCDQIVLSTAVYEPISGSSYIATPDYMLKKQAIVNVKNNDDKCSVRAVLSCLHPVDKDPFRLSKYQQYESELNVAGLTFPLIVPNGVKRFEQQNSSISVNIFANEGKVSSVYPIYATSHRDRQHHINLLMLT